MEDKLGPDEGTPAHQAFLFQGESVPGAPPTRYVGVDKWLQPDKYIVVGKLLAQFDHREPDFIQKQIATASEFFTDANTVLQALSEGKVNAQKYAEAVQVGPFRRPDAPVTDEHTYPSSVAVYRVAKPIKAADWESTEPAAYGQAKALNNIHFGEGSAPQVFLKKSRNDLLKPEEPGKEPLLVLAAILPCINTQHKLGWLKELEQERKTNEQITAAVPTVYKQMVDKLLQGNSQEQQRGHTMLNLQEANKQAKGVGASPTDATLSPAVPKPTQKSVSTPRAEPKPTTRARQKGPHH